MIDSHNSICIVCFLDDEFQESMRIKSRIGRERFEQVLLDFRRHFVTSLNYLVDTRTCSKHKILSPMIHTWCEELLKNIRSLPDVEEFITQMYDVYMLWIQGAVQKATNKFNSILESKKLKEDKQYLERYIFFRGRSFRDIKNRRKEEFYHIPFDQRYRIGNQRYSLSGQPILYLGLSIIDVLCELRTDINTFNNLAFSCFTIPDIKNLDIFDITNEFPLEITIAENIVTRNGGTIKYDDPQFNFLEKHKTDFYKFIIGSICSFKRHNPSEGQVFAEEYVIPQILTEVLRNNDFDGIVFSSTRLNKDLCYSTEQYHVNRYRENLALFTKYDFKNNYDANLLDRFVIGQPMHLSQCVEVNFSQIDNLSREIIQLSNAKYHVGSIKQLGELSGINSKIIFEKIVVKDSYGNFIKYVDHVSGKVHLYLLHEMLNERKNYLLSL